MILTTSADRTHFGVRTNDCDGLDLAGIKRQDTSGILQEHDRIGSDFAVQSPILEGIAAGLRDLGVGIFYSLLVGNDTFLYGL